MNESTLLSIKEFSSFTKVNQSTLRYYDDIGLLPAAERGENNYRYYTPFQLITLNFINVLIDLGIPLSTIKELNEHRTPEHLITLLSRQEIQLDYQLHELRTAYSIIHTYRDNIQDGLLANENEISVQDFGEARLILGPQNDFTGHDTFYETFIRFCNAADDYRINLRYPVGGYHDEMKSFLKTPGEPTKFFSFDPNGNTVRKPGKYLVAFARGYYGQFGALAEKMADYAKEHDLAFNGPVYSIYLLDEVSTINPDQYLSRVSVAVSPKKDKKAQNI